MAELAPPGGRPGLVMQGTLSDPRRHGEADGRRQFSPRSAAGRTGQGIWHLLACTPGCLFFFDIFLRRVAVSFWAPRVAALGRRLAVATQAGRRTDRIHGPPAQPQGQIAVRWSNSVLAPGSSRRPLCLRAPRSSNQNYPPGRARRQPVSVATVAEPPPEESYTGRLLKAKKKVWDEQGKRAD